MEESQEQMSSWGLRQVGAESPVRRRLVQSTLFPQGTKESDCSGHDYKEAEDEDGIKDGNQEDWCNSSNIRKRKSLEGKTNNNSRVAPQSSASKEATVNGKEISNKKVDSEFSPVIMKSDFFLKISERRQQKRQQEEQICIFSQEDNDKFCLSPSSAANIKTSQHLKQQARLVLKKQQIKNMTTPNKKVLNSGAKKSLIKRSPSKSAPDEQTIQFFPNLRLEAKMTAEENSHLYAGRPMHPFFSSWKVSKKNQEITEIENACCSSEGREESTTCNPIHVFETEKEDATSLNWGHWRFSEGSFTNFNSGLGSGGVVSEKSVNCLQFEDFPTTNHPSAISTCQNKISLDQCPDEYNEDNEIDRVRTCQNSDAVWKFKILQPGSCNLPENSLWTDKYQPRKAAEICGNGESVKFISEWLCLWHEKGSQTCKSSFQDEKTVEYVDCSCSQSDADSENTDAETALKNVLLVTGPVGSGKSAAIYACAEEQGFQIIEVNSSDWRNGNLVKQRFGEALESHWLQHKVENTVHSETKPPVKSFPGITKVIKGFKSEVAELIQLSDEEDSQQAYQNSCRSIDRENVNEIKTLILFEDVDATLSEDHGFLSTIQQLAQSAKRPMILTANDYNPVLPNNLDRVELLFKMPSLKELIGLGHRVCAAENVQIHAYLIDRLIEYCQRDVRKIIMHLQFWCQGQNSQKGNRPKVAHSPFLFDLEAGHQILPKLISWGYPSQLSELVEEEITKSLEESNSLVEIVVEEEMNDRKGQNCSRMHATGSGCIEAKKKEMLNFNYSPQVEDELLSRPQSNSDFSDISGSPVAFARRNFRRRLDSVMSSDSEEDNFYPVTPLFSGCAVGDTNSRIQGPSKQLSPSDWYKVEQKSFSCSETVVSPCLNGMSNLADMSGVPESLAVPETEVISEVGLFSATVSYTPHVYTEDVDPKRNYLSPSLSLVKCEKSCNPMHKGCQMLGSYSDTDKSQLCGEVVGDSHIALGEDVARAYQEVDECNCCSFARIAQTMEKPRSYWPVNAVEETWRRLRNCHVDLKQHVTPEQKDASRVLKLAFGMSNLISEADILLGYCQPHIYDSLESSVSLCEKSHSYRWYDDQLQMSSIFSQHGIFFYAKEASALGSNRGCWERVDLAWEMLSSSTNTMALAKLLTLDKRIIGSMKIRTPTNWHSLGRKKDSGICNVLQSVVSSRAYLALHGDAFHEYLSSLSQISRLEALHLSECLSERKQRRGRIARHYLSSGTYSLSTEDILLLSQCNSYKKVSHQSGHSCVG